MVEENANILPKWNYFCVTDDLVFDWFTFNQTSKSVVGLWPLGTDNNNNSSNSWVFGLWLQTTRGLLSSDTYPFKVIEYSLVAQVAEQWVPMPNHPYSNPIFCHFNVQLYKVNRNKRDQHEEKGQKMGPYQNICCPCVKP